MLPPAATPPVPPAPEASVTSRLDAYQRQGTQEGGGLAAAFNAALDGFGARSAQMQAGLRDIAARETAPVAPRPPAAGAVAPATPVPPANAAGAAGVSGPIALMVDCFNFAIEASLISRAATQFTGSVSTLMKGQ